MKRKTLFPFLSLPSIVLMLIPVLSWAGGVVQEFKVVNGGKVGQTSQALTAKSSVVQEVASSTARPQQGPEQPHCPFKVRYDQETNLTVLTWSPLYHNGNKAIRYHIYRWKLSDTQAQLISVVDGHIFRYIDIDYDPNETYFYKIVGIFHVDGLYVSRPYPTQELKSLHAGGKGISIDSNDSVPFTPPAPPSGVGCEVSSAPSSLPLHVLLLLIFFLTLAAVRRTSAQR